MYQSTAGLRYHLKTVHRTPSPTPQPPEGEESKAANPFECLDPSQPLPTRKAAARATERLKELTVKVVKREASPTVEGEESVSSGEQNNGVDYAALRQELAANGVLNCPYEVRREALRTYCPHSQRMSDA